MILTIATIHIAKSLEKPTARAKTCQRVWLPQRTEEESTGIQQKLYVMRVRC